MKLQEIYNLLYDKELLEIRKNDISYVLDSTYDYLEGYPDFERGKKIVVIDEFETFEVGNKLLLNSEVVGIYCYEILDCSELHIENLIVIDVKWILKRGNSTTLFYFVFFYSTNK